MLSMFPTNLANCGQTFTNQRTNQIFKGILVSNQRRPRIDFENQTDLKPNDWIASTSGQLLFVTEIFSISNDYKSCYYISEYEYNQSNNKSPTFSINANTIENSIIGTQANATISLNDQIQKMKSDIAISSSSDKEELLKIIALLEEMNNSQEPIPKGILSRFSAVMERNSWITGSIASFLLGLLQNRL